MSVPAGDGRRAELRAGGARIRRRQGKPPSISVRHEHLHRRREPDGSMMADDLRRRGYRQMPTSPSCRRLSLAGERAGVYLEPYSRDDIRADRIGIRRREVHMRLVSAALAGALLTLPAPTSAQVRAYTVPISNDRVVLRILTAGGTPAKLTAQNGGLVRVAKAGKPILGLTPTLRDGRVDLYLSVITKDPATGNEGIRQIDRLRLDQHTVVSVSEAGISFEIEWLETLPPPAMQPDAYATNCTTCCVTCGPDTYCGCAVETECGYCCCRNTCPCDSREARGSGTDAGCTLILRSSAPRPR